jgi:O-antigen/teichoic acid export membrane protein
MFDLRKSRLITLCIDTGILKEALKYSIPIIPHNLSTNIASFASRVFINQSGSLAYVGLYSVATQFAMLIDTIQASVNQAFAPWFFEMMNKKDETGKNDIVELSHFLLIIYSLVYMAIGLFSQEVIILMTNRTYYMAWTVIPILVIAFSVKSIYYFYINILFYYKDAAKKIFIATIIGSFADIMIAFVLVPIFGMYGAALSFLVAKIAVVSIVVVMSRKYHDIGYRIPAMLKVIMPSLLFMGAGLYFSYTKYLTEFSCITLLYKLVILFIYLVFMYMTNRDMMSRILNSGKIKQVLAKIKR